MTQAQTESMMQEADTFIESGNLASAINTYNKIIEIDPQQDEAYAMLGAIKGEQGDIPGAIESLEKAISIKQDNASAWLTRGFIAQQQGDTDKAIECFRNAAQYNASDDIAHYSLAGMLLEKGEVREAIASYQNAVQSNPQNSEAWYMVATILQSMGDTENSLQGFLRVLSIDENHLDAMRRAGMLQIQRNELDDAEETIQKAIASYPDDAGVNICMAQLRAAQSSFSDALSHADKARKLEPDNPDCTVAYADVLVKNDDQAGAIETLRPLLENEPPVFNAVMSFVGFAPGMGMKNEAMSLVEKLAQAGGLNPQQQQIVEQAKTWLEEQV